MLVIALVGGTVAVSTGPAKAGTRPKSGAATDCSTAAAQGVARQTNTRSSQLAVTCGLTPVANGAPASGPATASPAPAQVGAGDVNTITGTETAPHVTQSEDQVWANGSTVVVAYNDSATAPGNYSGLSRSTDSGHTFTRLNPSPFATGHGTNFGDPIIVFNKKLATWFGGDLADGCGGQGIGLWTSPDALTWTVGTCAVTESQGDRQSMTVDNTPTSPFYGRMYISWNDFNIASGALFVTHSDDGITWSPLQVTTTFIRDVQIGVTLAGNLLLKAMNEGGGAFNPRQNLV
ncbi:MAG: hypothetical protein QOG64_76, partial [Acidimicrobiaceae bacterium]|nr:hypothetical protein [Acidimicrobiaceae bacterium]